MPSPPPDFLAAARGRLLRLLNVNFQSIRAPTSPVAAIGNGPQFSRSYTFPSRSARALTPNRSSFRSLRTLIPSRYSLFIGNRTAETGVRGVKRAVRRDAERRPCGFGRRRIKSKRRRRRRREERILKFSV